MVKVETSIVIKRPVEEVFEFMVNAENDLQWLAGTLESEQTSEGPVGVGTTSRSVSTFLGKRLESSDEITEYEPNKKVASKSTSGTIPIEGSYTFESVEGGTKVVLRGQGDISGVFKLAEPLVARAAQRQFEGNFATLKDILEAD